MIVNQIMTENVFAIILASIMILWIIVSEILLNAECKQLIIDLPKAKYLKSLKLTTAKMRARKNKLEKHNDR